MFAIKATKREIATTREILKKTGEMPAVFYGSGSESTPISVSVIEFKKVWHKAGESSAVKINMPSGDIDVLIHEVQVDPITNEPIHADFLVIDMKKKIRVHVPVEFVGISGAVKSGLGIVVKVLHEIEVEALPADLPHELTADISKLETIEDSILVSDIQMPAGVVAISNPTDVVASIVAQKEEKEEEAVPVDLSAIEVEKKGKKEEEAGDAGETEAK